MEEWSNHLIEDKPDKKEKILRTKQVMSEKFPEAVVEGYEGLVPSLELPDPDDRHVLAAAIKVGAHSIVTQNLKDFPGAVLAPFEIEARTADEFILSTIELYPDESVETLRTMRQRYKAPEISSDGLILALIKSELVRTAAELQPRAHLL